MKNIFNSIVVSLNSMKKFIIWFILWSIFFWAIALATWSWTIWSLFYLITWLENWVWVTDEYRLHWHNIKDWTVTSYEIEDNTITEDDISDTFVARNSYTLDWIDSTIVLWDNDLTIPTSKAVKDYVDVNWWAKELNDLTDVKTNTTSVFVWSLAWEKNTWNYNTSVWISSLEFNTTWKYNTANWYKSLRYNTSWSNNTAYWYASLFYNTTWKYNTANWYSSLYRNTTWTHNTANWFGTLSKNTTWIYNTANWFAVLNNNTTWNYNTANWYYSMGKNTTWTNNTANWLYSLYYNTIWNANTVNWNYSLHNNSIWSYNTANWYKSLYSNTTWNYNVAIWNYAWYKNISWSNNVFIWKQAWFNETGSNKLYIDNTSTTTPLIKWDFATNELTINWKAKMTNETIDTDSDNTIATKWYVDWQVGNGSFGEWDNSYNINTVYQASNDGFVTATWRDAHNGSATTIRGLTDWSNPPITIIVNDTWNRNADNDYASITFPVKKGDYWKVARYWDAIIVNIHFIPLN